MPSAPPVIKVDYRGRIAILTIDNPSKLNALSGVQYYELAQRMQEVAEHDEVYVTILIGKGRFFSAGADVKMAMNRPKPSSPSQQDMRKEFLTSFVLNNLHLTRIFYTHPKILVVGLNGPVIGLSAALVAFADFVYCTPSTFLLTPFSSLGLVAEGGASLALVRRLGRAKANEALLMSKRVGADDLKTVGFVNEIFDEGSDEKFKERVLREIEERLGPHLNGESLLGIKKLTRFDEGEMDKVNVKEVYAGLDRFMRGVPQEEFRKIATGEKRHKL